MTIYFLCAAAFIVGSLISYAIGYQTGQEAGVVQATKSACRYYQELIRERTEV